MGTLGSKSKTSWFCKECGNESAKWLGCCPSCGAWNSFVEAPNATRTSKSRSAKSITAWTSQNKPKAISQIDTSAEQRILLNNSEIDRILGGGIVPGSLILLGGEPGIGKSTLSLQIPLYSSNLKTLYVTGEESEKQVKMRADRLGGSMDNCFIYSETNLDNVLKEAEEMQPDLMIVDSVQTMFLDSVESTAGSISQIKEVAASLLRFAKETSIPIILIGHITKDGSIAGPKIFEHIVDVVLQFEGESKGAYRLLRSIKNRFGSTAELGVFEMSSKGLIAVENPSQMLIPLHSRDLSGTAIASTMDGSRSFLLEVQALVSSAVYGTAQRSTTGFDTRRLNMLLAVLEKRVGFKLSVKDVFLNMAGGLKINDTSCDMAVVAAVLSSNFDSAIPSNYCFSGEVGLSGEIRPIAQIERRINEAERLGFDKIFISSYNVLDREFKGIEVVQVDDIPSLVKKLF